MCLQLNLHTLSPCMKLCVQIEQMSSSPSKMIGTGIPCGASDGVGGSDATNSGGGVPPPAVEPTSGVDGGGVDPPPIAQPIREVAGAGLASGIAVSDAALELAACACVVLLYLALSRADLSCVAKVTAC